MDTITVVLIAGFFFLTGAAVVGLIWYLRGVSGRMGGNSKNNAINNPERTREYLDISSVELQRLSLLVDKVLKLSMFEQNAMEFAKEPVNMKKVMYLSGKDRQKIMDFKVYV